MSPRFAEARDGNELAIVRGLLAAGATVQRLTGGNGRPDLLVGYEGRNYLLEVKNPTSRTGRAVTKALGVLATAPGGEWEDMRELHGDRARYLLVTQAKWHRAWRGAKPAVVMTLAEARAAIGVPAE